MQEVQLYVCPVQVAQGLVHNMHVFGYPTVVVYPELHED